MFPKEIWPRKVVKKHKESILKRSLIQHIMVKKRKVLELMLIFQRSFKIRMRDPQRLQRKHLRNFSKKKLKVKN